MTNSGPSGTFRFNFNDPSTPIRFASTDIITYDVSDSESGPRVDFTGSGDYERLMAAMTLAFTSQGREGIVKARAGFFGASPVLAPFDPVV